MKLRWRRRGNKAKMGPLEKGGTKLCAIYTRKSTDENLDQAFNSLDSQREYCGAFIKSREPEGWQLYPHDYTDPGWSGGNMDRPGLQTLLADARKGKFQVVVCYKYDRLSRNTKDFLEILDIFDKHGVAFVSVTQPIDTTSSVGRLMRSILVDFSQFERELISERTRDKMAAMAKKGRWLGHPIIGYDFDYEKKALVVNEAEAAQVKEMFETYIRTRSLSLTALALNARGCRMKCWTSRTSKNRIGGRKFNKCNLFYLLTNPVFIGKVRHHGNIYDGEHKAILDPELFARVNKLMELNGAGRRHQPKRKDIGHTFLLQGLLRCGSCGYAMTPNFSHSRGNKFFYYRCLPVTKLNWSACCVKNLPAGKLEEFVLERLSSLAAQPELIRRMVAKVQDRAAMGLPEKQQEKIRLAPELGKLESRIANLVAVLSEEGASSPRKADILGELEKLSAAKAQLTARIEQIARDIQALEERRIEADVVQNNLRSFGRVFAKVPPKEQQELVQLMVREAVYERETNSLRLSFRILPEMKWEFDDEGLVLKPVKLSCPTRIRT